MKITKALAVAAAVSIGFAGLSLTASGCKKKDDDTEEESDSDEEEATPEPTAEPSASAQEGSNELGDVETYPDMTKAGGTYRLLKRFYAYRAADEKSKKLTGLAPGTLVDFKHYYHDWIMIDWPSGPGQLSPGWIHLRKTLINVNTKKEERPDAGKKEEEKPDAGKDDEADAGKDDKADAGKDETPDAGKKEEKPDAGRHRLRPGFHFKIPKKQ